MQKFRPCLWFDNQAEEAANFYVSIFKNSRIKQVAYYTDEVAAAAGQKPGTVMTVIFELDGQEFMGLNGGPVFKHSEAISFMVDCKTSEEVDELWEKLSAGGLKSNCGWLKDKFGLSWQIIPSILNEVMQEKQSPKSRRVMAEVMKMDKLDTNILKRAAEQG